MTTCVCVCVCVCVVQLFRAQTGRSVGGNGRRMSHNPPEPVILDIYDRVGVVVMDENRQVGSVQGARVAASLSSPFLATFSTVVFFHLFIFSDLGFISSVLTTLLAGACTSSVPRTWMCTTWVQWSSATATTPPSPSGPFATRVAATPPTAKRSGP